jgi:nitroimidazol reductase NimA-like FMN-containing flavoprotein (pyridoxamine 5'-phosphate oxidase superfamily)
MSSSLHQFRNVSATALRRPRIRPLTPSEVEFVLARNCVARIAFQHEGKVELMPIHYVYIDGVVFGRIAMGVKYLQWLVVSDVVLEVDEIHALFDWRSIVMRGTLQLLSAQGTASDRLAHRNAVEAIRTLIPSAFTDDDPTPDRQFIFRIDPSEVTGREASTRL